MQDNDGGGLDTRRVVTLLGTSTRECIVGLRAVTVLYGGTASMYGIRTEAVGASNDTVQHGRRRP